MTDNSEPVQPDRLVTIPIAEVHIGKRFRQELGDLEALADSISKQGLLQPIGVTKSFDLVFGERRLTACRDILGLTDIDVRIVDVTSIVEGEHDENEVRKDFTMSERLAIGRAIEAELGERRGGDHSKPENFPEWSGVETRDIAAQRSGFGSGRTYEMAKAVILDAVPELVEMLDGEEISISAAAAISKQPHDAQTNIIALPLPERREIVADIRQGASYSMGDSELKRKMSQEVVDRVQTISMGFHNAYEVGISAQEFLRDALPYTQEMLAGIAPALIAFLQTVEEEVRHDQTATS